MQTKIEKLQALQVQIRRWRLGGVVTILVIVASCLWHVRQQSLALLNEGPTHDKFMTALKNGLANDAVPEVKKLTAHTLDRLGPILQKEMVKIERRMPEFTARAEKEMDLLRQHLPERAERALKPSIGKAMENRLAKWRVEYPNLTADQLSEAAGRLTAEAHNRMANVASAVMLPYEDSLEKMVADLAEIRHLEAGHDDVDPWDLAVVSLGLLHEELVKLTPQTRQLFVASLDKKEIK
ncbi:MAG: hypothetical protein WCS70_13130 [Verrucomicrobiota bacterium]